ncbi:hypothetical protein [Streptomyces sp. NBRC 110035]|uniref:hypothetical protein n=1 Tax=Streptomyces sp. NBRC 110035 TaxID=1547867 RepID=UPI0005A6D033|nr:hypothetical protein [Streptomyces sp. NBRC 110035]
MGIVSGLKRVTIDAWSWLNYKPIFADPRGMPHRRAFPEAKATWVPPEDERRLAAYKLLAAYDNNQAAELSEVMDGPEAREKREFGDPSMFVDAILAHVLGREQHITVPGADATDATGKPTAGVEAAERVQTLLRDWAEAELLAMRVQQTERKAVALGDGVYRLAWDPAKQRATVRAVDPGFYFPVLPEDGDGEFPERAHFAWELPEDPRRDLKPRIRRITYELGSIGPATAAGVDQDGRAVRAVRTMEGPDGNLVPVVGQGDTVDPDTGTVTRLYAWNDQPSYVTCYLTDATWNLEDLKGQVDVDSLPLDKAVFATRSDGEVLDHLDLLIDFIPVVHVPNTVPPAEEHWGQSSLAKVLQVFDELAGSDTDSARASATTGLPMIAISGVNDPRAQMDVGPGAMFKLGENGKLTAVDTSPALRELREHTHDLADRAAKVARLPAVALGTMNPSQMPSGYALQLSLGPLDSLIASMRLARDHKYALLLKFVQRLHLAGQHPDWAGVQVLPAKLTFGPYTPTDRAAILEQVALGVEKGVLSKETGIVMLIEAGFPIEDAAEELKRIDSRAFIDARALADALGNPDEVARFLNRQAPDEPETPPVILPPAGGDEDEDDAPDGTAGEGGGNTP